MPKKYKMDEIKEILRKSFDTELSIEEQELLENTMQTSEELQNEKASLLKMRSLFAKTSFSFSDSFMDDVVEKSGIESNEQQHLIQFFQIFKRIAITGAAAIIALLISIYVIDGTLSSESLFGISEYSPEIAEFSFFETPEIE